jgi:hypothetical protein
MTRHVFDPTTLHVSAWPDPVIDQVGHDPRSDYVETYWLGVVGPSTILLLRRLSAALAARPEGPTLDVVTLAASLGLQGGVGRNSPIMRTLDRACGFGLARQLDPTHIQIRRKLPPLTRTQVGRLPESLQRAHLRWQDAQRAPIAPCPAPTPGTVSQLRRPPHPSMQPSVQTTMHPSMRPRAEPLDAA